MQRVAITGLGITSCIGNGLECVTAALRSGSSGIRFVDEYRALGLNSQVAGIPDISCEPKIDRKLRRFMGDAAIYAYHAMRHAIDDARITQADIQDARTGLIIGSGVGSPFAHYHAMQTLRTRGLDKVLPYTVPQVMGSTCSANLAMAFGVGGPSYSLSAACATSAHCIGNAWEMIRHGVIDRAFVGGSEEIQWTIAAPFDAMGALSTRWNDHPQQASRPFDCQRDGFVIAGGAGVLLLESETTARQRGAHIHAYLSGYGASTGGSDMVVPDISGCARAMQLAMAQAGNPTVDYINPHATSTLLGDTAELDAIRSVFGHAIPAISATKGLTGHAIGAISAQEAILCVLMMKHGFIPNSANLDTLEPACRDMNIVRETIDQQIDVALSNSIGFGGTNASLVITRT
jgi:3-oxoacyl-[acyl-carrier-protein] synthase-1